MRFVRTYLLTTVLTAVLSGSLFAWTVPVAISDGADEAGSTRIAKGSAGSFHVAYRQKGTPWRVYYRYRSGSGPWGPIETISNQSWADRPDVFEDAQGRPHIFYTATGAAGLTDLFEAVKQNGVWNVSQYTNTSNYQEHYARAEVDGQGRIHLVYFRSDDLTWGNYGDVAYRVYSGGSWSADTILGRVNNKAVYHRAEMCLDPAGNVHVVWCQDQYTLVYRKCTAGSWSPKITIGTTTAFFSYPTIAAPSSSTVLVVTFDQVTENSYQLKSVSSSNGGSTWGALTYFTEGHTPSLEAANGIVHLVYQTRPNFGMIGYRTWNGTWSGQTIITPSSAHKSGADIAIATDGVRHVVYYDGNPVYYINGSDIYPPPGPPSGFGAIGTDATVRLSWTNPPDPDFAATVVRYRTDRYPTSPTDGFLACEKSGVPGSADSFSHTGLVNGTTYYYTAFARNTQNVYSAGTSASSTPHSMTLAEAKLLADKVPVDLAGKIVTAVFGSDSCIYIEEADRSSGIRVATTQTGLAVGDIVNVSGSMDTRKPDGVNAAERQVVATSIVKAGSGTPLEPISMVTRDIGGEGIPPYVPGVLGGIGLNNIGLLVQVAGRVSYKVTSYIYVDDGWKVPDISGRYGVMVRCPSSTIPVEKGDMVKVTGIVEGSIPSGWTTNRRYLHIRDWNDLVKVN